MRPVFSVISVSHLTHSVAFGAFHCSAGNEVCERLAYCELPIDKTVDWRSLRFQPLLSQPPAHAASLHPASIHLAPSSSTLCIPISTNSTACSLACLSACLHALLITISPHFSPLADGFQVRRRRHERQQLPLSITVVVAAIQCFGGDQGHQLPTVQCC